MSSHILVSDPNSISSRFSDNDKLGYSGELDEEEIDDLQKMINEALHSNQDEEIDFKKTNFDSIEVHLDRIPHREADLIRLYYKDEMKQEQIAKLFGITQAAVSYRLARGRRRIQFLTTIPVLDKESFEDDLYEVFPKQDMEIMWLMYETTCQSEVAKQLGLTQGRVRHRFFRSLSQISNLIAEEAKEKYFKVQLLKNMDSDEEDIKEAMDEMYKVIDDSKYSKYHKVFSSISDKRFNILHEVSLPQFKNRGDFQIITVK